MMSNITKKIRRYLGKISCSLGYHQFPRIVEVEWVVCERHCLTEKNQKTGEIHKMI